MAAPFASVLLATDGSDAAAGAVRVAIQLAGKCGARVSALAMALSNPEFEAVAPELVAEYEAQARRAVEAAERQAAASGVVLSPLVRHGDEGWRVIVEVAGSERADLIVMGRRGKRGLMRRLMGSTTAQTIGHSHCPVLVVPRAGEMPRRGVLLATDGSPASDAAALLAARVATTCALPVTVLSVSPPHRSDKRHAETAAIVERTATAVRDSGVAVRSRMAEGREHDAIVAMARDVGADLIVLGSHGRTGLGRLLMGSTTERVIGLADCPVLVAVTPSA